MNTKMKWMAAFKIWLAIYPSITFVYYIFGKMLSALPLLLRTFLITISLVPWIIFAGLPIIDSIIKAVITKKQA